MSRVFQSYQPFQHIPLRLDINSILIGLAAVLFVDVTPIEYAILTLSGIRVRLDVISFFIGVVILISIQRYTARLVDTANLYAAAFITLLILSSQWSPSQTAVDVYIMQALTIIPLAYGLGLCMGRCHPIYVAVLYILAAIPTYLYLNPDFSEYNTTASLLLVREKFTYQGFAECYFLAAFGAIVCAVHVQQSVLRFGLFAMALFFSIAILQTGGRGGILTLGASIAAVTFYQFPRWRWPIVLILLSIGLITKFTSDAALFELYKFAHSNGLFSIERLLRKLIFEKVDVRGRDELAMLAVAVWSDHPWLGIGLGGFPLTAGLGDRPGWYPHNMFLEVLAEQGLVGFIMFGGLFWLIVSRYLRIRLLLPNTYKVYIVGFTAAALARAMVSGHIESDPQLWILAGFIVSLSWEYEQATCVCLRMLPARHQQEGTAAIGSGAKPRPENAKRRRPW